MYKLPNLTALCLVKCYTKTGKAGPQRSNCIALSVTMKKLKHMTTVCSSHSEETPTHKLPNTRNWLLLSLLIVPSWIRHSSHICDNRIYVAVYPCFICGKITVSSLIIVTILWRISWFSSALLTKKTISQTVHNRIHPGRFFSIYHSHSNHRTAYNPMVYKASVIMGPTHLETGQSGFSEKQTRQHQNFRFPCRSMSWRLA
jgi:hypothetical protein